MNVGEFANLVFSMREAQREYFKLRRRLPPDDKQCIAALQRSQELEAKVDAALAARALRLAPPAKGLFDGAIGSGKPGHAQ